MRQQANTGKINGKQWAVLLFVYVGLCAVLLGAVILTGPADVGAVTPGSHGASLMNGGAVLADQGFFVAAEEDGVYRYLANGTERTRIYEGKASMLQAVGNRYYFETEEHALYSVAIDGTQGRVEAAYARRPQVVGSWAYYVGKDGTICKKRLGEEKEYRLGVEAPGQIAVYYGRIYYLGGNRRLYHCALDGKDNRLLADRQMERFMLNGRHIFFLEQGTVYSAADSEPSKATELCKAERFAVEQNMLFYQTKDGLFLKDLDSESSIITVAGEGTVEGAQANGFYYKAASGCYVDTGANGENKVEYRIR